MFIFIYLIHKFTIISYNKYKSTNIKYLLLKKLICNISAVIIVVMVFQGLKHNDVFHIVSFLFQFITTHMLQAEKPKE